MRLDAIPTGMKGEFSKAWINRMEERRSISSSLLWYLDCPLVLKVGCFVVGLFVKIKYTYDRYWVLGDREIKAIQVFSTLEMTIDRFSSPQERSSAPLYIQNYNLREQEFIGTMQEVEKAIQEIGRFKQKSLDSLRKAVPMIRANIQEIENSSRFKGISENAMGALPGLKALCKRIQRPFPEYLLYLLFHF